jgi:hypothetical protein
MTDEKKAAFVCTVGVPGWRLHVAQLYRSEGRELGNVMEMAVEGAFKHLSRTCPDGNLGKSETIMSLRERLLQLGIDSTANPPCSELLIAGFIAAGGIPRGSLSWEYLAVLTAKSQAPWIVLDRGNLRPPLRFIPGERGLPALEDQDGVVGSPWSEPTPADLEGCTDPVFICCLPEELFRTIDPKSHLGRVVWLTWAFCFAFERSFSHRQ